MMQQFAAWLEYRTWRDGLGDEQREHLAEPALELAVSAAELARMDLSLDVWCFHRQLPELIALAAESGLRQRAAFFDRMPVGRLLTRMTNDIEMVFNAIDGRPNTKGGAYHINLLPTTCHVYFGSVTGATPDGRKAGTPLSEGISPVQGADRHGPTAVLKSAVMMLDHAGKPEIARRVVDLPAPSMPQRRMRAWAPLMAERMRWPLDRSTVSMITSCDLESSTIRTLRR